jgi:hypothetical protein
MIEIGLSDARRVLFAVTSRIVPNFGMKARTPALPTKEPFVTVVTSGAKKLMFGTVARS